jgi:hypothetical protein
VAILSAKITDVPHHVKLVLLDRVALGFLLRLCLNYSPLISLIFSYTVFLNLVNFCC